MKVCYNLVLLCLQFVINKTTVPRKLSVPQCDVIYPQNCSSFKIEASGGIGK